MTDALKIAVLVFVAGVLQASVFAGADLLGGTPDVLLLVLLGIALQRGAVAGAAAGFLGGLLLDVATLESLGVTSLLLTLVGYWAGRFGEATGRDRRYVPPAAILAATVFVALGGYTLHYMLGADILAERALVTTLLPGLGLNLIVGVPVLSLCRVLLRPHERGERVGEVQLLG